MRRSKGKKVVYLYNNSGSLDRVVKFLENIKKKISYIDLNVLVEGKKIKVSLFGPRDLQYLAYERLKELAQEFLE